MKMKRQQSVYGDVNEQKARACVNNTNVSYKHASEACAFIRGKPLTKGKAMLERVLNHEIALPLRRFNKEGAGHKPGGVGPGRYPEKAVSALHDLLQNVEVNARQKGIDPENAKIIHICAHKGANQPRYGRSKRGIMKRCNMEIIIEDTSSKEKKKSQKRSPQKPQQETKKEAQPKKETEKTIEAPKADQKETAPETATTSQSTDQKTNGAPQKKASTKKKASGSSPKTNTKKSTATE